jgi:hypothetical protein
MMMPVFFGRFFPDQDSPEYIQSEEGKPFCIEFTVIHGVGIVPAANSVAWNLELDGFPIQAGFLSYIGGMMSRVCPDMEKSKLKERVRIGGPGRQGLRSSSR